MDAPSLHSQSYAPPNDRIQIHTNEPRLFDLADRLWVRADPPGFGLDFTISVVPDRPGERAVDGVEEWNVDAEHISLDIAGALRVRIELSSARATGQVTASFLATRPADVARLLLETPAAVLLSRRNYVVVHAGTIVGPAGAIVLRGPSGSGKSTLVAAAHRAGFGVLGDETVLVAREDCDELAATVRDLTVLPETVRLLGIESLAEAVPVGDRHKRRIDLFGSSTPAVRRGRRVTTVLLGARDRASAQLVPLAESQFMAEFRTAEIAQERWAADPDQLATTWGARGGYRLDGASDLSGALRLLQQLSGLSRAVQRAS